MTPSEIPEPTDALAEPATLLRPPCEGWASVVIADFHPDGRGSPDALSALGAYFTRDLMGLRSLAPTEATQLGDGSTFRSVKADAAGGWEVFGLRDQSESDNGRFLVERLQDGRWYTTTAAVCDEVRQRRGTAPSIP